MASIGLGFGLTSLAVLRGNPSAPPPPSPPPALTFNATTSSQYIALRSIGVA